LGRIKAGAGDLENAAELEIVTNDLGEEGGVGFGGVGARNEIGDGDTLFCLSQPSGNSDPILPRGRARHEQDGYGEEEPPHGVPQIQHVHPLGI